MTNDPEDMDEDARADVHARHAAPPLSGLRAYSTTQMQEEIARRRNARVLRGPVLKCDECRHFQHFEPPSGKSAFVEPPKNYNACTKDHVMSFRMPDADDGPADQNDDWGFYRRGCTERETNIR